MYRVGAAFPGKSILRIGTVDDFNLHETKLRPRIEQFTKDRVGWLGGVEGVKQVEESAYTTTTTTQAATSAYDSEKGGSGSASEKGRSVI